MLTARLRIGKRDYLLYGLLNSLGILLLLHQIPNRIPVSKVHLQTMHWILAQRVPMVVVAIMGCASKPRRTKVTRLA